jgi:hypothetical protein
MEPFILSARDDFARHGTDWSTEFSQFTYWNYFTADRADTARFYPEGKHYPRFLPNFSANFSGNSSTISSGAYALSSCMFEFRLPQDTLTAIVANTDFNAAYNQDNTTKQLEIDLTKGVLTLPHVALANGYNIGILTADPNKWQTFYTLSSTGTDVPKLMLQASPNPLRLAEASQLLLPLNGAVVSQATVYFLSSSLTLQYSGDFDVKTQSGNQFIIVPTNVVRSRLSSGIYFVVAKSGDSEFTWKVAVIQ